MTGKQHFFTVGSGTYTKIYEEVGTMKRYALIVFSVLCIMGIMSIGASPAAAVKVGIVLPLTGAEAKFGEIEKRSFEMAVDEINKQGGIKGENIELIVEDDTGRPEVGRSVAEKLINKDKVVMLGGGYSSSCTYAVAGVAQQNRIPFLVNTGSADKITTSGWDYVFRLNPPVSEYAGAIESLLVEVIKPQTVVILHENSLFGTSGAKSFEETCTKLGYKVLLKQGYEAGGIDFKPVLIRVRQLNPDIIYMVSYIMDASLLMKQAKELKLEPKMFIGGAAGFTMPEFKKNAGVASEKVISATLWYQNLNYPGAMQYFKNYKARYKDDTEYHGAEAYAAAQIIADALIRAKSFQPADIGTKKFVYPVDWLKTWKYTR